MRQESSDLEGELVSEMKYFDIVRLFQLMIRYSLLIHAEWNRSNNVLVGRLYNNIGEKFRWIATGELFLPDTGQVILI